MGKCPRAGDSLRGRASYSRSLRAKLRQAVAEEAYERAAKLRDEIRRLEESQGDDTEADDDA